MQWHVDLGVVLAAILTTLVGILVAGVKGVFHLGKLAKDKEQRDKQVDVHEIEIGGLKTTVQKHGWRLKRIDPEGEDQ